MSDAATLELQELLDALDPQTRTLLAEADLGLQAQEFMRSDLGRHLVGCAHQEIAEAQAALSTVAPWRRRRITDLQNRIWRANFLLSWLRELLLSGKVAGNALEEAESGE